MSAKHLRQSPSSRQTVSDIMDGARLARHCARSQAFIYPTIFNTPISACADSCGPAMLEKTGLPPHLLQIELTESVMLSGAQSAAVTMHRLADLGVSLAIDDFGT